MQRHKIKRKTDSQIISGWIGDGQRVLDIGCGRGLLLEHLIRTGKVRGLGVDTDLVKVQSCVKRGVPVYHGDADSLLKEFPDQFFDWIILSRMVQELTNPGELIRQSLRVATNVAVGFVNHGYWLNRWSILRTGSRPTNEVFPLSWEAGHPYNPVTVTGFNSFAQRSGIHIANAVFLKGNWRDSTHFLPNLTAGYAIYHLQAPPA
ncbi:MAG TPA: methionine biosynthesis protein MetW [Oceanipulchritudo sp.]|nr:methionine biosynthesis protein MetW [Oceanipulchritudo sp.]